MRTSSRNSQLHGEHATTETRVNSSSGVTGYVPGGAVHDIDVAPEDVLTDEHETSLSAGRAAAGHLYDVWCVKCGHIAPADSLEQARAIARLHEEFIAVLADGWEVR